MDLRDAGRWPAACVVWTGPGNRVACRGTNGTTAEAAGAPRGLGLAGGAARDAAPGHRIRLRDPRRRRSPRRPGTLPHGARARGDVPLHRGRGQRTRRHRGRAIARRIRASHPAFLVHVGDFAYTYGTIAEYGRYFFAIYRRTLRRCAHLSDARKSRPVPSQLSTGRSSPLRTVVTPTCATTSRGVPRRSSRSAHVTAPPARPASPTTWRQEDRRSGASCSCTSRSTRRGTSAWSRGCAPTGTGRRGRRSRSRPRRPPALLRALPAELRIRPDGARDARHQRRRRRGGPRPVREHPNFALPPPRPTSFACACLPSGSTSAPWAPTDTPSTTSGARVAPTCPARPTVGHDSTSARAEDAADASHHRRRRRSSPRSRMPSCWPRWTRAALARGLRSCPCFSGGPSSPRSVRRA